MKKITVFLAAAAFLLITAGVFAGKSKFTPYTFYATNGTSTYKPLGIVSSVSGDVILDCSIEPIAMATGTIGGLSLFAWDGVGHYYQISTTGW